MSTIDNINLYPDADKYWTLVERTLSHIFQESTSSARNLRREIGQRPEEEQLQFYHAEPLDVAADLAKKQPDEKQVKTYRNLAADLSWK